MLIDIKEIRGEERLVVTSGYASRTILKELPGARWSAELRSWTYPLYLGSALAAGKAAELLREPIIPSEKAMEWVKKENQRWSELSGMAVDITGGREPVEGFFPHQQQCAEWLSTGDLGGRLDTSEMGTGKTRTCLRAAWNCWNNGETGILLVSTLKSVKSGWAAEVAAVAPLLPLPGGAEWSVFVVTGSAVARRKVFAAAEEANTASGGVGVVVVINHEQLRTHSRLSAYGDIALKRCSKCGGGSGSTVKESQCHAHEKELNKLDYVAVAFDECHRLMVPQSQQTRAAWSVADGSPRAWGLTGTPGSTSVMEDTWALMRLVCGSGFPPKSSWCSYYASAGYNILGFWEVGQLRPEREPEFRATYGAVARRVLKAQVLDLPPLLRGGTLERHIEMGKEQRAAYDEMLLKLRFEVENGLISVKNALAQTTRLIQLASSSGKKGPKWGEVIGYDDEGNPKLDTYMERILPSNKVDAVVDMVLSKDVGPGTVFQFVSSQLLALTVNALVQHKAIATASEVGIVMGGVPEAVRAKAMSDFQSGRIPFFAFTAAAGGAGITLTRADTMVAVERPWSPILWQQAQDRVHRIGSEIHSHVSIIDLISENTVEVSQAEQVLTNKLNLSELVGDRQRLLEVLS